METPVYTTPCVCGRGIPQRPLPPAAVAAGAHNGEVTEWFKVTVLKTVVGQLTASSNLALSAIQSDPFLGAFLYGRNRRGMRTRGGFCFSKNVTPGAVKCRAENKARSILFSSKRKRRSRYVCLSAK